MPHVIVAVLVSAIVLACGATTPPATPHISTPDASAVERLLGDAMAQVDRLAGSPPPIELPSELSSLLEEHDIRLPAVPGNAAELCAALGTPGLAGASAAGLGALLEGFATGGEVGLAAAVLTTVVFSTCPAWSPHLETVLQQLF